MIEKANRFGTLHDPNKPGPCSLPARMPDDSCTPDLNHTHTDTFGLYNPDPTIAAADKENGGLAKSTRSGHTQIDREKHKREVGASHLVRITAPSQLISLYCRTREQIPQLEDLRLRLTAAHEKDVAKLHSKLAKLEQAKADYKKDRDESTKERDGLKSEIRTPFEPRGPSPPRARADQSLSDRVQDT